MESTLDWLRFDREREREREREPMKNRLIQISNEILLKVYFYVSWVSWVIRRSISLRVTWVSWMVWKIKFSSLYVFWISKRNEIFLSEIWYLQRVTLNLHSENSQSFFTLMSSRTIFFLVFEKYKYVLFYGNMIF